MRAGVLILLAVCVFSLQACAAGRAGAKDDQAPASAVLVRGAEAYGRGDFMRALERFNEARRLYAAADDRAGEALALINTGRAHIGLGDADSGAEAAAEAIGLLERAGDLAALSEAHATLSKALFISGRNDEAASHIEKSLQMGGKSGNKSGAHLNMLAAMRAFAGREEEARGLYEESLRLSLYSSSRDPLEAANSLRGLASLTEGKDAGEALGFYSRAYELDRDHGGSAKIATDLKGMAGLHRRAGRLDEAAFLYERAYKVSLSAGLKDGALESLDSLIEVLRASGGEAKAEEFLKKSGELLGSTDRGRVK